MTATQMRRAAEKTTTPNERLGKKFLLEDLRDPARLEYRFKANDIFNANRQPNAVIK